MALGGSLKIWQSHGWFCIRFHFPLKASFIVDIKGRYCVFFFLAVLFQERGLPVSACVSLIYS